MSALWLGLWVVLLLYLDDMKFLEGTPRDQAVIYEGCLDNAIEPDNEVRVVDAFVHSLNLEEFGFKVHFAENGRPAYRPTDLLKLFIYGYLNKIRSSRALERECKRNIEIMWLLNELKPDHNTIANFRKNNPKAIKKVFRATVQLAKHFNLIGAKLLAGDSTKLRAQNSKKNNFNQKKIDRHMAYIDNKLEQYYKALVEADGDAEKQEEIKDNIDQQNKRKEQYKKIENELEQTGQIQISLSDPDSRNIMIRNGITEVAYNVQSTVDAEHCIPIDYQVTNENDAKAMGPMLRRAKTILGNTHFTALFDTGYHTGSEFEIAHNLGIKTIVSPPSTSSTAPNPLYNVANFGFNEQTEAYTCPEGNTLTSNGSVYTKVINGEEKGHFKRYSTDKCKTCPVVEQCTRSKHKKRYIERNVFTPLYEENLRRIQADFLLYKRRKAIVEHPFGTIKRSWGFDHIMTKQFMHIAKADVGLIFCAYNLRRIINIIGINKLLETLKAGRLAALNTLIYLLNARLKPIQSFFRFLKRQTFNSSQFAFHLNNLILFPKYKMNSAGF